MRNQSFDDTVCQVCCRTDGYSQNRAVYTATLDMAQARGHHCVLAPAFIGGAAGGGEATGGPDGRADGVTMPPVGVGVGAGVGVAPAGVVAGPAVGGGTWI